MMMAPSRTHQGVAKDNYDRMFTAREPYLRRAREAARITIPHLMTEYLHRDTVSSDLAQTYQSIGARGVNNLSARMSLSMFPVNEKFFRLQVDKSAIINLKQFKEERAEIEQQLSEFEDMVIDELETSGLRIKIYEALRQLVTCGNALMHVPQNDKPRVFKLDSYVVDRDPRGNVVMIVTEQRVSKLALSEALQKRIEQRVETASPSITTASGDEHVDIYTIVQKQRDGTWNEWQEINGQLLDRVTTHDANRLPYIALRMYSTDGEAYGRGHVEEYIGDLKALEGLREAMVDAALAAAKVTPMVNPDGVTRIKTLQNAPNGRFISGRADDVSFLQLNKFADLRFVAAEIEGLKRDIGLVFLLNSTIQRNQDRVTATEVRLVAQELEDTLGGIFSLLSADLQMPLVSLIMGKLQDRGAMPKLPDMIKPVIVTGLAAIGRGHDAMKIRELFAMMQESFGPDAMSVIKLPEAWKVASTALGVDLETMLKSPEELQADQQRAMMQQVADKLGPAAIKEMPEQVSAGIQAAMGGSGPALQAA